MPRILSGPLLNTLDHHAVARDALTRLRHENTPPPVFRRQLHRLSLLLAAQATGDINTQMVPINTPLAQTQGTLINACCALVPIMRAGHGMLDGFLTLLPDSKIWHLSMSRSHEPPFGPIFTDSKVPPNIPQEVDTCFILDPMLATGGSACFAVQHLKDRGAHRIVFVGVLAAQKGVDRLYREHPDVIMYLGAVDPELNERGYIVPGLGDAGDRLYPTG